MAETYEKVDGDTLRVTVSFDNVVTEVSRAEIQTQLDHLSLDKIALQAEIDTENSKIAILNA